MKFWKMVGRGRRNIRLDFAQGRNFGLKIGVPIQKENEAPLGPEARGEENGEKVPPPDLILGSGRAS